ncbi:MAG: C25 family cysteine peptidase, partial [bacterium]
MNTRAPKRSPSTLAHSLTIQPNKLAACLWIVLFLGMTAVAGVHAEEMVFTLHLSEGDVLVQGDPGATSVRVRLPGYLPIDQVGMPDLPFRIVNVILPQGHGIRTFEFASSTEKTIVSGVDARRVSPMVMEDGKEGKGEPLFAGSLEQMPVFPPVTGKYLGTGYQHGYAIASFAVYPVRFASGTILLSEQVTLRISTGAAAETPWIAVRQRLRPSLEQRIRGSISRRVINPEALDSHEFDLTRVVPRRGGFHPTMHPSLEGSPVDYLIITSDALSAEYQRLADWKTAKGVPTVVRTIEWIKANCRNGVDLPETLRFFIRDAYEKWGIGFVLLGGDSDVIPPRYGHSRYLTTGLDVPAELYYACLDGSWNDNHDQYWGEPWYYTALDNPDLYAEVYLGRLPASNLADAATMIDKTIAYETPVHMDFTDDVLLLAVVLFPPDYHEGDPISFDGADISELLYNQVFQGKPLDLIRAYETYPRFPGSVELTRQATLDWMDGGANIINHVGHGSRFNFSCGDASVVSADVDLLVNQDRPFVVFLADCHVSAFDYNCIAEHMMTNPNGGAVATIGASHYEYPAVDVYYMNGFYDLIFNHGVRRIGEALADSRLARTPYAEIGDNIDLWTHYVLTLLSDPEMPVWTGQVGSADVNHPSVVGLGTTSILVNVTSGGQPVDSAYVCLSKG